MPKFLPLRRDGFNPFKPACYGLTRRLSNGGKDIFFENITFKNSAEAKFSGFFSQSLIVAASLKVFGAGFLAPCINSSRA